METVRKIEEKVASWYKNAPHLPADVSRWIATNAWWLALIGLIFGAFGVLSLISIMFFAGAVLTGIGGAVGAAIGGIAFVIGLISLLFSIVILIILAMAIQPLKAGSKKGWNLLFLIALLEVASLVFPLLFAFDVFGTLWGLLWAAVGAYFLFEIRQYFMVKKAGVKTVKEAEIVKK